MQPPMVGPQPPDAPPSTRCALLAFLFAFTALFTQVLVHRLVSAKLLNNYAFLVISLTMLGFAAAGVLLSFFLQRALDRLAETVALSAALFTLSALLVAFLFCRSRLVASVDITRPDFVVSFFRWAPYALLFAVPFGACGLLLGALLSHPRLRSTRIYFADLVGSALGAVLVLPAIRAVGVEPAYLILCGLLPLACLLLLPPRRQLARLALGLALLVAAGAGLAHRRVLAIRFPEGSMLAAADAPGSRLRVEHMVWDPLARIEVSSIAPPDPDKSNFPSLIGDDRAFHARFEKILTQNNFAFTYAVHYNGDPAMLAGIEQTIYAAAYKTSSVPRPRVAIIGVGGGFDVLTALRFDASRIRAVEVNRGMLHVLTRVYHDYFKAWVDDPRVQLVNDEGRHYLATHEEPVDVLQLSGVDSYSGTPGAAHVFSENYLYTEEAFDLYLRRLSPQGILHMMRLELIPPREMLRALVTATAALRRAGARRPADHIVVLAAKPVTNIVSLLIKRTPFTNEELRRVELWAGPNRHFSVVASRQRLGNPPNFYRYLLALDDPQREQSFVESYPFNIAPPSDDSPFFFRTTFWWHIFPSSPAIWGQVPVLEYSLILLFLVVAATAWLTVRLPLRRLAAETARGRRRFGIFFSSIGVGFMAIELALLQKFGLFLGHPNYALSVVLAVLLLFAGLGSLVAARLVAWLRGVRFVAYALAGMLLLEELVVSPSLTGLLGLPLIARAALVVLLVAPVGLLLGVFMPTGLEKLKETSPRLAPWAWGVNGIFSVLGPLAAIAVSVSVGMRGLLLAAIPIYLVAGWALPARAVTPEPSAAPRS
jgi:hypothetical protein